MDAIRLCGQVCYNKYCRKVLTEEDFPRRWDFSPYHFCEVCWKLFDGQKMRGRFRMFGFSHEQFVAITAGLEQLDGIGPDYTVGHPSEELRYTENEVEWIEWQKPKEEKCSKDKT